MNLPNRRSFFAKLFLAAGAASLFPRLSKSAPIIGGSTLTGTTTIPAGSTLVAAPGSTLNVTGANLVGFPAPGTGPGSDLPADLVARLDSLTPRYAIFEIPLGINGSQWKDFELKGSVNNFSGTEAQALIYFYGSQYGTTNSGAHASQVGLTKEVYYTDDLSKSNHAASRKWIQHDPTRSIFEQCSGPGATIGGVVVVVPIGPQNPQIRPDNANLKFIYQRVSPQFMEDTWVPIVPKWATADFSGATVTGTFPAYPGKTFYEYNVLNEQSGPIFEMVNFKIHISPGSNGIVLFSAPEFVTQVVTQSTSRFGFLAAGHPGAKVWVYSDGALPSIQAIQ